MIRNQFLLDIHEELIVDNFAGGGGASTARALRGSRVSGKLYYCSDNQGEAIGKSRASSHVRKQRVSSSRAGNRGCECP